jgi:hypothetical protein
MELNADDEKFWSLCGVRFRLSGLVTASSCVKADEKEKKAL